ncbi:MAG: phosphatase PAP2 family protein [Parcubacteria group bacterium]|jgi:undecaprenyl-diphosphatase
MELKIVKFFNNLGGKRVSDVTDFASRIPVLAIFWSVVAVLILILDKNQGGVIFLALAIATFLHFFISEGVLKHLLPVFLPRRIRPYLAHPEMIIPNGTLHQSPSFPSSHMSITLGILMVLFYFYPVIWPVALLYIIFMAYARLHNGMHYLSDIIGGIILGILYGILSIYLVK